MSGGLSTKIHVGLHAIGTLQDDWLELEKRAECHPFGCFHWCMNQARLHSAKGQTPLAICVYNDQRCVAILPLVQDRISRKLPFKCLKHMCSAFTDYQEFVVERSDSAAMLFEMCLNALVNSEYAKMPLLFAYPSAQLRELCSLVKHLLPQQLPFNHWRHSYYKRSFPNLKSKVIREARRRRKKLFASADVEIRLDIPLDESLVTWVLDQNALRFGSNRLTDIAHRQSALQLLFDYQSSLHLSAVLIDGHPAAAHLGFMCDSTLQYYLLAADDKYREFSVGIVLLHEIITAHPQVTEIDFLRGDEEYKKDWANVYTTDNGIVCLPQNTHSLVKWIAQIYTIRNQ
ncbi:GNAT family N-acetyltransferase [Alteromonas sp. ASW11-36]|uniref:GNAT family N-acetyltransferase n=1 Tax=Alteromonas arenosi TaxID=3055817 RepID=A0ABT7STX3_9ALTE|nr:GNAT family N-acetyltransferase [Alteromonas sp. ASW11-36]MDM7859626.1 GNAT family N-acetyltransferase [Alteromonas sp. ASW11-36]